MTWQFFSQDYTQKTSYIYAPRDELKNAIVMGKNRKKFK